MKRILLAVFGSLVVASTPVFAGCGADGTSDAPPVDSPSSAGSSESGKKSSSSKKDSNGHPSTTLPAPADPDAPPTPSTPSTPPSNPSTPPSDPANPADPGQPTPPSPPGSQTTKCTATIGADKSVTTFVYIIDKGTPKISKMTVQVTNKDNRNKNDVDVFVTPQGGMETKSFNSGDILPSGKVTEVPLPSTFTVKAGVKVRVSTNFDELLIDPSASCIVQF